MEDVVGVEDPTALAVALAVALAESVRAVRHIEAERFARVARWADLHPPRPGVPVVDGYTDGSGDRAGPGGGGADEVVPVHPAGVGRSGHRERAVRLGGEGTPALAEFAAVELGMLLETTTCSATTLLRDALEVRHRLPSVWRAVMAGRIEVWKARKAAASTRVLGLARCREVDARVAAALEGLPFGRALSVVEGLVVAADPEGHEARRRAEDERQYVALGRRPNPAGLRTLVAQITAGDVARLDAMVGHLATLARRAGDTDGVGVRRARALALLADPARACLMLAAGPAQAVSGTTVELGAAFGQLLEQQGPEVLRRLRPRTVLYVHLAAQTPLDAYEIPPSLAEVMELREPFEVFPWGTAPGGRADLDHTEPWCGSGADDRPGQTGAHNLGPLGRHHHRAKTFGSFRCYQPLPGLYVWRSPSGHWFRVDHTGTRALGRETPAILRQLRDPDPLSAGEQQLRGRIVHHLGA